MITDPKVPGVESLGQETWFPSLTVGQSNELSSTQLYAFYHLNLGGRRMILTRCPKVELNRMHVKLSI
jgi:hypothetical protein